MEKLQEIGSFLDLDKDGFLGKECDLKKLCSPWTEAVSEIVRAYLKHHAKNIHSIYLRGSLPRGLAIEGKSDIDTFALVHGTPKNLDLSWIQAFKSEFLKKFKGAQDLEMHFFPVEPTLNQMGFFSLRFTIKHLSVCLYGEDLGASIPPFKPDLRIAYAFHGMLGEEINQVEKWLKTKRKPEDIRRACQWIMKRIVRTGFAIVIHFEKTYTRDLYYCYEGFSKHYPQKSAEMFQALQLAITPSEDEAFILATLKGIGEWLADEARTVYRKNHV